MALVAPPDARAAAYRAYVSAVDLDEALRALAADATLLRPLGAWEPRPGGPPMEWSRPGR